MLFKESVLINLKRSATKTIIFSGGGTGGHIYPGLALAYALLEKKPNWQVHFVGSRHGLETQIVPQEIPLHTLPITGWQKAGFLQKCKVCLLLPCAFLKSIYLLLVLRPQYILGMGGYASGPLVMVGSLMGFHTAIWEMNAYPGLTNRILSRFAKECWFVFDSIKPYFHSGIHYHKTSIPVRREIEQLSLKKLNRKPNHILIFGGSLGASKINHCIVKWVQSRSRFLKGLQIRLQTGPTNYQEIKKRLKHISNVQIFPYLDKIAEDYKWADIVICRGGASTIAELAAAGKASILIPFRFASEDHQKKNVEALYNKKACLMILEKNLTPWQLEVELSKIINNQDFKKSLETNILKWHKVGAIEKITQHIMKTVNCVVA